eukprot:TRINITY_DN1253_c0_g1_i1.p1 TRINITY_DN1253_c0_g1~~TRINITY_DN1253_c0_g1_i1.p1  ORF type:complete len:208 (+),score=47.59 TRINITY_DN1253_c0_g1_i1:462-1085(+)
MKDVVIVSLSYRLAPEHRFPDAVNDIYSHMKWISENINKYGGDPSKLFIAGESAGANLAFVYTLKSRDEGGVKVKGAYLNVPVTDLVTISPSRAEFKKGYILSKNLGRGIEYVYADKSQLNHPYISPIYANHLDLPPVLIHVAEYDPLRDEGIAFYKKLKESGNDAQMTLFSRLPHGFASFGKLYPEENAQAIEELEKWIDFNTRSK